MKRPSGEKRGVVASLPAGENGITFPLPLVGTIQRVWLPCPWTVPPAPRTDRPSADQLKGNSSNSGSVCHELLRPGAARRLLEKPPARGSDPQKENALSVGRPDPGRIVLGVEGQAPAEPADDVPQPDITHARARVEDPRREAGAVRRQLRGIVEGGLGNGADALAGPVEPGELRDALPGALLIDQDAGLRRGEDRPAEAPIELHVVDDPHRLAGHLEPCGIEGVRRERAVPHEEEVTRRVDRVRRGRHQDFSLRRFERGDADDRRVLWTVAARSCEIEEVLPIGEEVRVAMRRLAARRIQIRHRP